MSRQMISVVLPCYNESQNLPHIVPLILESLKDEEIELIMIDDGSSDNTLEVLHSIAAQFSCIKYISFSKNFGHQVALKAGLDYATGDCVISMDADGQHPPFLLPAMLAKWREGYDVVHTLRDDRKQERLLKKWSSSGFYTCMRLLTNLPIKNGSADFRLLDKRVVQALRQFNEDTYFWRALTLWVGFKQTYIDYQPAPRAFGSSKYTFKKMLGLALLGITSFSLIPLRVVSAIGLFTVILSLIYLLYSLFVFIVGDSVPGWTSMISLVLVLSGVQLLSIGVIGEYIGKIHMAVKGRPTYIVKETNCA